MENITALFALEAEELLVKGFPQEAIDLCNKGLEIYPEYTSVHGIIARAYLELGNNAEAEEIMDKAIRNFPGSKVLNNLGKKEFNRGSEYFIKKINSIEVDSNEFTPSTEIDVNTIQEFNDLNQISLSQNVISQEITKINTFKQEIDINALENQLSDLDNKINDIELLSENSENIQMASGYEYDDDDLDFDEEGEEDLDFDENIKIDEDFEEEEEGYEEDYEFFEEDDKDDSEEDDLDMDFEDLKENVYINKFETPILVNSKELEYKLLETSIDSSDIDLIPGLRDYNNIFHTIKTHNFFINNLDIPNFLNDSRIIKDNIQKAKILETKTTDFQEKFVEIAEKLDQIEKVEKTKKITKSNSPKNLKSVTPTETLAEIFVSQGINNEAIKIYKQLAILNPENAPIYKARIKDIRRQANQ